MIADRLAHAQQTRVSSQSIPCCFRCQKFSGEFCLRLKPYLVVEIASDVLTEHCCQVCILAMMFCCSDCRLCACMCGKWLRNQGNSLYQRTTCFGLLTLRQANMGYEKYSLQLIFTFYLNRDTSLLELFPVVVFQLKNILRVDSSRRARDTAAMLDHSRHRGESATKTVKFFVAHTVNCVICNNHAIIEWMLLNFAPVIQQNYHQPGRKFEKSFCAVDRLSCQLELSKSETSQFRSDRVFDIVNYMYVIFLHEG